MTCEEMWRRRETGERRMVHSIQESNGTKLAGYKNIWIILGGASEGKGSPDTGLESSHLGPGYAR